jgi:hypothetical protein
MKPRTAKRIAVLRELASLGITQAQAATLTGVSPPWICELCKKGEVSMPKGKPGNTDNWLERRLLRDHHLGLSQSVMAERYGTSRNSVAVTIHRLRQAGKLPPVQPDANHANVW